MLERYLLVVVLVLVSGVATLHAQGRIVARIENLRNDKGVCRVCLFNDVAAFSGEGGAPVRCLSVPAKGRRGEAIFEDVPPGTYAVMVFHDENSNNRMDKNVVGIPKEGYGASRNQLPFAAAPGFTENSFSLPEKGQVELKIRLRNL